MLRYKTLQCNANKDLWFENWYLLIVEIDEWMQFTLLVIIYTCDFLLLSYRWKFTWFVKCQEHISALWSLHGFFRLWLIRVNVMTKWIKYFCCGNVALSTYGCLVSSSTVGKSNICGSRLTTGLVDSSLLLMHRT